jgi:hypothetical protein
MWVTLSQALETGKVQRPFRKEVGISDPEALGTPAVGYDMVRPRKQLREIERKRLGRNNSDASVSLQHFSAPPF